MLIIQVFKMFITDLCMSMISSAICRPIMPAPSLVLPGIPGTDIRRVCIPLETTKYKYYLYTTYMGIFWWN